MQLKKRKLTKISNLKEVNYKRNTWKSIFMQGIYLCSTVEKRTHAIMRVARHNSILRGAIPHNRRVGKLHCRQAMQHFSSDQRDVHVKREVSFRSIAFRVPGKRRLPLATSKVSKGTCKCVRIILFSFFFLVFFTYFLPRDDE